MGTALDALNAPQPLTARRPATSNLPTFELPPPPPNFHHPTQKYHSSPHPNVSQPSPASVSVGNLLTPPTNAPGENGSPLQSGLNHNAVTAGQGVPSYPSGYWQSPNPYAYGSNSTSQTWNSGVSPVFPGRGSFSPSLASLQRNNSNSPSVTEGVAQPYDMHQLPPFQTPGSVSSSSSGPGAAVQQQQQQHAMTQALLSAHGGVPASAAPQQLGSNDAYATKQQPPMYGAQPHSTPPQPNSFPHGYGGSAVQSAGLGIGGPNSRMSSVSIQPPACSAPQMNPYTRSFPAYSLPSMSGPIMTNVHNPGNQMSMVGTMQPNLLPGFNSGHAASMQHLYGGQAHQLHNPHRQPGPPTDRPFRCTECPQSFNRNHDLKRHSRIHLAVKPFPCSHCDKSFSRKDALKRHILVKKCGPDNDDNNSTNTATSTSPSVTTTSKHEGSG